jgi:hypothetical protein
VDAAGATALRSRLESLSLGEEEAVRRSSRRLRIRPVRVGVALALLMLVAALEAVQPFQGMLLTR